jgi:D-glycero-D-manno-heptose 1,7-bisphosphate phosphatase
MSAEAGRARAIFLDRDGTLIDDPGYLREPELVRLLPGAAAALHRLRGQGWKLVLVSNQSGVGRGLIAPSELRAVHARLCALLADTGVQLDGSYYCEHAPEAKCACRKPRPALLRRAANDLGLDLARSFMIGDKLSDLQAGRAAGCASVLLATGQPVPDLSAEQPCALAGSWADVLRIIER